MKATIWCKKNFEVNDVQLNEAIQSRYILVCLKLLYLVHFICYNINLAIPLDICRLEIQVNKIINVVDSNILSYIDFDNHDIYYC